MIDPADFEKYLKLQAEAEDLKQKMIVHAQRVAVALYGAGAKITGFGKSPAKGEPYAYGYISDDEGIHMPMELCYAADWEAKVAERHEKERIRFEKLQEIWEKEKKQREEDKELKDLERLKKKYPDMV
jgi:hypothetical protein